MLLETKETHFTIREQIHQEGIMTIKIHTSKHRAPKYMKKNWNPEGEISNSTKPTGDFNTPLSIKDRKWGRRSTK